MSWNCICQFLSAHLAHVERALGNLNTQTVTNDLGLGEDQAHTLAAGRDAGTGGGSTILLFTVLLVAFFGLSLLNRRKELRNGAGKGWGGKGGEQGGSGGSGPLF